jgi:predicted Zn-dependent protease
VVQYRSAPVRRGGRGFRVLAGLIIAIIAIISYCAKRSTNPVTGEVQHVALTAPEEIALGLHATPEIVRRHGGEVANPSVRAYVTSVGQRVVSRSDAAQSPYRYDFHVLADPETVNAFALPGGPVFVTVGLLRRLGNEAQLAGVLGHEIGHVVGRHGAEHLAQRQLGQGLSQAVGVAASDPERRGQGAAAQLLAAATAELVTMSYGREDEIESDAFGSRYMKLAGYDPVGMQQLMATLQQAGGGRRRPEFLSTHPDPGNRIERLQAILPQIGGPGGETGEAAYQQNVRAFFP